jgi:hypothetical protein
MGGAVAGGPNRRTNGPRAPSAAEELSVTRDSSPPQVGPFPCDKRSDLSPVVLVLSEAVLSEAVIEIHSCADLG